jgi:hypothetical protein
MVADPQRGRVYVAYELDNTFTRDAGNGSYEVLVAASDVGGLTFPTTPAQVMACLPMFRGFNHTAPTLAVDVASPAGRVWAGFTDERGNCSSGCPSGVIALSDDQGQTFQCTPNWTPGRDLVAAGDVRGSPQPVIDFKGRLFLAFAARSKTDSAFSLYVTRFDSDAMAGRGQFLPPDATGTALSRKIFGGTVGLGNMTMISFAADPYASLWLVWPGQTVASGPGLYSVNAP